MNDFDIVYEAHFAMPGQHIQPSMLRLQVDYSDGSVYLVRKESHYPEAARTRVYRFDEPQDDDWRAGHGVALDSACRMLMEVSSKMGILGYRELPTSPGWSKPAPCVFENYVNAERSRHPLPVMH
ncbi:MAG: hypothetical protein R3352_09025 [Salinisphaeraceae bacterium]|nr:hypothetical protein [Salinisphaeraceae bacterium]